MTENNLGPYIMLYDFVFHDLNLKSNEALVYSLIYSYTNSLGGVMSNNAWIAKRFNMSERSLRTILANLIKDGKIEVHYDLSDSGKRERVLTANYNPGKRLVGFGEKSLVLLTARDYGYLVHEMKPDKFRAAVSILEKRILANPDCAPNNESHRDIILKIWEKMQSACQGC